MKHNICHMICHIAFGLFCAGLFYLMPYLAWHTAKGDRTDTILGMVLAVIPLGLLLLSALYGFLVKRMIMPICIASILVIPAIFIPIVAGNTAGEKLLSYGYLTAAVCIIVCIGTSLGIFTRHILQKCISLVKRKLPCPQPFKHRKQDNWQQ